MFDVEISHIPVAHKVNHIEMSNLFEHLSDELSPNAHTLVVGQYTEVRNICAGHAIRDGGNPADDRSLRRNSQNKVMAALKNPQMRIGGGWIGPTLEVTPKIFGTDSVEGTRVLWYLIDIGLCGFIWMFHSTYCLMSLSCYMIRQFSVSVFRPLPQTDWIPCRIPPPRNSRRVLHPDSQRQAICPSTPARNKRCGETRRCGPPDL